jgi:hypothetical protein
VVRNCAPKQAVFPAGKEIRAHLGAAVEPNKFGASGEIAVSTPTRATPGFRLRMRAPKRKSATNTVSQRSFRRMTTPFSRTLL